MANKISVLIDVATDKAVSGLKGFKASINDADGAMGKMKAGAASAFDSIKANAGNLALAAGAALVTFGVKAVGAFQDAALAAGKFADATGLSTEEASRWVAVADDIGISGESMEKAFGKLAVAVGKNNPLLEEYGITVQKNAAGQDDMNATMLHAIDVIKGIKDPTVRAAVAQAALGKGWMDMAELIEQGSDTLTTSMAEVSEAQVIDPEEVEKARKMRESMDNLNDAVGDLALVMGEELVPMAGMAADALTAVIGPLSDLNQWSKRTATSFYELIGVAEKQKEALDPLIFGYGVMGTALDAAADSGDTVEVVMKGVTEAIRVGRKATRDAAEATADLTAENTLLADAIQRTTDRYRDLKGELSAEEAFHAAEGMWRDLAVSAEESYNAAATGAEDAEQKAFDHAGAVINAKQKVVELGEKYADLPKEKITKIVALIDQGQLAEAERQFNNLARNRQMQVSISARGGIGGLNGELNFAGGGTVPGPIGAPQIAVVHGGEQIFDPRVGGHAPSGGGSPISITVNAGMGADGKEIGDIIVGKIREYERRNGNGWRG